MSETEVNAVCQEKRDPLCRYLEKKFPRLGRSGFKTPEDVAHDVIIETLEKVQQSGFTPDTTWWRWLRWLASKRAIDVLRKGEEKFIEGLTPPPAGSSNVQWQPPDPGTSPSGAAVEGERRKRQVTMLSQIIEEYCRRCEKRPQMLKQKEVLERALRGQKRAEIAQVMGISGNLVDVDIKRARDWITERARRSDVHHSVLQTLLGCKPED